MQERQGRLAKNIAVKQRRLPPQRTCISCRKAMDKRRLLRVVRTPEGAIEMDPGGKTAGRGAYLCTDYQCWRKAVGSQRLARALKCSITSDSLSVFKEYAETLKPEVPEASRN